jgi:hypothetical protein
MEFKLNLPKYLKKYIVSKHGTSLMASYNDAMGQYICLLIQSQRRKHSGNKGKRTAWKADDTTLPDDWNDEISINISNDKVFNRGFKKFPARSNTLFVKRFADEFYAEFHRFMDGILPIGFKIQAAIELFMNQYGLSESEIKVESLHKSYYRYRQRYGKPIRPKRKTHADSEL